MLTIDALTATALGDHLATDFQGMFGSSETRLAEVLRTNARLAIEWIANSVALYHNYVHTVLVSRAGRDILRTFPDVDVLFVGVGTGGTATGCARYLSDIGSSARVIWIGERRFGPSNSNEAAAVADTTKLQPEMLPLP